MKNEETAKVFIHMVNYASQVNAILREWNII